MQKMLHTSHVQPFVYHQPFHRQTLLGPNGVSLCHVKVVHAGSCIDEGTALPSESTESALVAVKVDLPKFIQ